MHFSCSRGFLDITTTLLEAGADPLTALDKVRASLFRCKKYMHQVQNAKTLANSVN